jgi:hypothetical protein
MILEIHCLMEQMWIFDTSDSEARLLRFRSGHSAPPTCIRSAAVSLLILENSTQLVTSAPYFMASCGWIIMKLYDAGPLWVRQEKWENQALPLYRIVKIAVLLLFLSFRYYGNGGHILSGGLDRSFRVFSTIQVQFMNTQLYSRRMYSSNLCFTDFGWRLLEIE